MVSVQRLASLASTQKERVRIPYPAPVLLAVTHTEYYVGGYVGNIRKARVAINYDNDGYGLAKILCVVDRAADVPPS